MKKINRLLLMLIAMVAIMIAAVGIDRGIEYRDAQKWEKERIERYEQAYAEVSGIQMTISELSQDQQAITAFIEENKEYFEKTEFSVTPAQGEEKTLTGVSENDMQEGGSEGGLSGDVSGNAMPEGGSESGQPGGVSGNAMLEGGPESGQPGDVSGNAMPEGGSESGQPGDVSGNAMPEGGSESGQSGDVSGNAMPEGGSGTGLSGDVSGNAMQEGGSGTGLLGDVSGNAMPEGGSGTGLLGDVSGNAMPEGGSGTGLLGDVSGNDMPGSISGNGLTGDISGNALSQYDQEEGNAKEADLDPADFSLINADLSLQERRKQNSSYIETQNINQRDRQIIAASDTDFSQITVACLGDSITQATNLEDMEDYQQYSYPARLEKILGAEAVYNLGIGGSSIGRYWENAFVDRYEEIPQDTDVIIVMGGTNDGFCITQEELGNMEDRAPRTFIGDLDELMKGLKADYPDALIVFATPLPNVLHDMLRKEREYLLPQKEIVDSIKLLAEENDIPVIDLYNSNLLDSHDAAVIFNYMPDGVHGNAAGYEILAEHMAAELIGLYEERQEREAASNE